MPLFFIRSMPHCNYILNKFILYFLPKSSAFSANLQYLIKHRAQYYNYEKMPIYVTSVRHLIAGY